MHRHLSTSLASPIESQMQGIQRTTFHMQMNNVATSDPQTAKLTHTASKDHNHIPSKKIAQFKF